MDRSKPSVHYCPYFQCPYCSALVYSVKQPVSECCHRKHSAKGEKILLPQAKKVHLHKAINQNVPVKMMRSLQVPNSQREGEAKGSRTGACFAKILFYFCQACSKFDKKKRETWSPKVDGCNV